MGEEAVNAMLPWIFVILAILVMVVSYGLYKRPQRRMKRKHIEFVKQYASN
jgi:preprotein translocase subunit YajC